MKILLKPTLRKDVPHRLASLFNKYMKNKDFDFKHTLHSGANGILFSFEHQSDDVKAQVMINKERISVSNFIVKSESNWANSNFVIDQNIRGIQFDKKTHPNLETFYQYLMVNYLDLEKMTSVFELMTDEDDFAVNYLNHFINQSVNEKSLFMKDSFDIGSEENGYQRIPTKVLFSENHDAQITLSTIGDIHIESKTDKINHTINIPDNLEKIFKTKHQNKVSYHELMTNILATPL